MAAKEAEKKDKEEGAEEAEKPKSKKKLIIIIAVVLILVGAGVPFLFMGGGEKPAEGHEEEHHEEEKHLATAKLDTFIVNLSENTTFLKVTILLEYDPSIIEAAEKLQGGEGGHGSGGEAAADALPPLFEKRKPMIHDAIIRVLSSKKSAEVLTADGKEQLKQDLIEVINEAIGLDEAPVVNIYFTEFIIQ